MPWISLYDHNAGVADDDYITVIDMVPHVWVEPEPSSPTKPAKPHGTAPVEDAKCAVKNSSQGISPMTIEIPVSFPKIALSITAKCSAVSLATAAKLPDLIFRTLRKAGVSAVVTSEQSESPSEASAAGAGSTGHQFGEEEDERDRPFGT